MTVSKLSISPAACSVGQYARASANTVFAAASRPVRMSPQPMKSPDSAMVSTPTCGEAGRSRHWPSAPDWRPCWDAALVEPRLHAPLRVGGGYAYRGRFDTANLGGFQGPRPLGAGRTGSYPLTSRPMTTPASAAAPAIAIVWTAVHQTFTWPIMPRATPRIAIRAPVTTLSLIHI